LLIVDCEEMSEMDISGAREFLEFQEELASNDVAMYLTRIHGQPARLAQRAGIIDAVGEENVFITIRSAVDAWNERHPAESSDD
jgi:MFS superfamily sulfate permease-like transporter